MKKLVLATFVSILLLSGCASKSVRTDNSHIDLVCPAQYPRPITLIPLTKGDDYYAEKGRGILLTASGWSKVILRMHESERFGTDAVALQLYMEDCIKAYNDAHSKAKEPEEKPGFFKKIFK
jgi:hypothetical protein